GCTAMVPPHEVGSGNGSIRCPATCAISAWVTSPRCCRAIRRTSRRAVSRRRGARPSCCACWRCAADGPTAVDRLRPGRGPVAGKAGVAYNSDMESMILVLIAVGIGLVLAPVLRQGGGWFRGVAAGPPIPVLEHAATGAAGVD